MSERSGGRKRSKQSEANERVSGASEQANERTDERAAQYYSLYSWLISTIVVERLTAVAAAVAEEGEAVEEVEEDLDREGR